MIFSKKITHCFVVHRMKTKRVLMLLIAFLILFTSPVIKPSSFWELTFDWISYFLIIIACLGRVFSAVFICGTKNEKLSTQGPFSIVRNPLYVFSFIGTIGFGLFSGHLVILGLLLMLHFMYYPEIVKSEEDFLLKKFGSAYEDYQRRVPRWFPRTLKMQIPETTEIYPRIILKNLLDSSLFFLIFPLVEMVEVLQAHHVLPALFSLY